MTLAAPSTIFEQKACMITSILTLLTKDEFASDWWRDYSSFGVSFQNIKLVIFSIVISIIDHSLCKNDNAR